MVSSSMQRGLRVAAFSKLVASASNPAGSSASTASTSAATSAFSPAPSVSALPSSPFDTSSGHSVLPAAAPLDIQRLLRPAPKPQPRHWSAPPSQLQHSMAASVAAGSSLHMGWAAAVRGGPGPVGSSDMLQAASVRKSIELPSGGRRSSIELPGAGPRRNPTVKGHGRFPTAGIAAVRSNWSVASSAAAAIGAAEAAVKLSRKTLKPKAAVVSLLNSLKEGSLVGFHTRDSQGLALIKDRKGNSWRAIDHRGFDIWLHPEDLVLRLPGEGFVVEDCKKIFAAGSKQNLPEAQPVWQELMKDRRPLYLEELATSAFGDSSAASQWLAFRLAVHNRPHFKQIGRKPPCFEPRLEAEVLERQVEDQLRRETRQKVEDWSNTFRSLSSLPLNERPTRQELEAGPHSDWLSALDSYARTEETGEQREVATQALAVLGFHAHPNVAADVLMKFGFMDPYVPLGLLRAQIPKVFAREVVQAAELASSAPCPDPDAALRKDLRHHKVITIDDESTTEIDDGLSVDWLQDGRARVWVHISDPTRWLKPNDALDMEASKRVSTVYLPSGKIPMFPEEVAEQCFSLRAGVDSCAVSVCVTLNGDGSMDKVEVMSTTVNPAYRLTYNETDDLLRDVTAAEEPELFALEDAARLRTNYRKQNGSVHIDLPDCRVTTHFPEGPRSCPEVTVMPDRQLSSPSQVLVTEMMVLAGEAMAKFCGDNNIPAPFRGQTDPVLPTDEELTALPPGPCRAMALRRRMTRSVTVTGSPSRHAGLGLNGYVQFTSPIRRYGDLLAHFQVKAFLRGEMPPYDPKELSTIINRVASQQQDVNQLDRECRNYWLSIYFQQKMNQKEEWRGLVAGWTRQEMGMANILIEDLGLELVQRIDRPVRVGDTINLRCTQVDLLNGTFRLEETSA